MSATLINLTPHRFTVYRDGQAIIDIPPSGRCARIVEDRQPMGPVEVAGATIDCMALAYRPAIEDLPAPSAGVLYLVSRVTAAAVEGRPDVVFPLDEVRDDTGRIIGCRGLGRFDSHVTDGGAA